MNNPSLHLMRKVEGLDQGTIDYLEAEAARIRKIPDPERLKMGNPQPYNARRGLVDNNWARDEWATLEVMAATTGFEILDNAGTVLAEFETEDLGKAELAYKNSKMSIQVDFTVPADAPKKAPKIAVASAA